MADIFETAGIKDVSLLDSISLPAPICIDKLGAPKIHFASSIKKASLFGPWQLPLTMKYLYDFQIRNFSVCAGGGIQHSQDIIELLLLGAQATQIATAIILGGYAKITEFLLEIENFMQENNLSKLHDFQAKALAHYRGKETYIDVKVKYNKSLCINCRKCVTQKFCNAILIIDGQIVVNEEICDGCSLCAELCPSNALYME